MDAGTLELVELDQRDSASGLLVHDCCDCWDMDGIPRGKQLALCGSPLMGFDAAPDEPTDCVVCPQVFACRRCGKYWS